VEAIRAGEPRRVLEVGGGQGWFAERLIRDLGVELVGIDQSEHMVELQRARGIDARVGDIQELDFADGEFDCVVANWMLYHVPDRPRAFAEIVRVLRPGGRLVAITNGAGHLRELGELIGRDRPPSTEAFGCENAVAQLEPFFVRVERREVVGEVQLTREAAERYVESIQTLSGDHELKSFEEPLAAHTVNCVLVAETAA
jgi:ubiquinone/menaquinone biosynthesis C-methylase UbiE